MNTTPLLPDAFALQLWLNLGWASVLLYGFLRFSRGLVIGLRAVLALMLVAWCWWPGTLGATHWLGLAFQSPSALLVGLCLHGIYTEYRRWRAPSAQGNAAGEVTGCGPMIGLLLVTGWLLLLDTVALLPFGLYAWGFEPVAVGLTTFLALLPWLWWRGKLPAAGKLVLVVFVVLVLVALRLPTGNVWDAWLDPWLWVFLHVYAIRSVLRACKGDVVR